MMGEVRIRTFYRYGYVAYVFCNDPETLEKVVFVR